MPPSSDDDDAKIARMRSLRAFLVAENPEDAHRGSRRARCHLQDIPIILRGDGGRMVLPGSGNSPDRHIVLMYFDE